MGLAGGAEVKRGEGVDGHPALRSRADRVFEADENAMLRADVAKGAAHVGPRADDRGRLELEVPSGTSVGASSFAGAPVISGSSATDRCPAAARRASVARAWRGAGTGEAWSWPVAERIRQLRAPWFSPECRKSPPHRRGSRRGEREEEKNGDRFSAFIVRTAMPHRRGAQSGGV